MNMTTKQEIFKEKLSEYLAASKAEKGRILDAVCDVIGVVRKSAIRRFRTIQLRERSWRQERGRKVRYGPDVTAALQKVWDISGQICAERLQPIIVEYIRILQRDNMWSHGQATTGLLLDMSIGTMKLRLASLTNTSSGKGRGATKPSELKEIIPIRRGPWVNPPPGQGEVDTVAHCGYTLQGDFCYTVQYTDIATVWTCLAGQWNKGQVETLKSIEKIKTRLPFPLLGIDPDSGSEFINWNLKAWCDTNHIAMTRTRPYMKNDHARIEQKNYTNIRKVVGYTRLDNPEQVDILNDLYLILEDYINFFVPSLVCVSKERIGSRMIRHYDQAQTAYQRVLARADISNGIKETLRLKYATLNPLILRQRCDLLIKKLLNIPPRLR